MGFSWSILGVMLLLGAVQLAVGVVLGRCLPIREERKPREKHPERDELDRHHLRFFADRLRQLVTGVSGEVDDHRHQISEVNQQLARVQEADSGTLTEFVLRSVARIMVINERLQTRLTTAEQRLRQQNEQIEEHFTEARTDPLTALMNRRAFDDALKHEVTHGRQPFALIMVDVDHFKERNDEYGHPAGDQLLCSVSRRMEEVLAGLGMVARFGGEEFAMIIPKASAAQARQIAEQVRAAVAAVPFSYEHVSIPLTVSVGATLTTSADDAFTALKRSDEALYVAKRSGRNCAFFHDGTACRRIEADDQITQPVAESPDLHRPLPDCLIPPAFADADTDSLEQISADLRRRMAEIAGPAADKER